MSSHQFMINDDIQGFFYQSQQQSISEQSQCEQKNEGISTHLSSRSKKLLRNKVSAQNSRQKKKKYIQDLQQKQKQLLYELQQTQKDIDRTKQQLNNILSKNKQNDSFNHDQKHTYRKLASLIKDDRSITQGQCQQNNHHDSLMDEDQANMLIELLINRVGVTGKQRRRMVQYYTKRLMNFSVPAIYRYLLNASTAQKGLFTTQPTQIYSWDSQLYNNMDITTNQSQLFKQSRTRIAQLKNNWTQKISNFHTVTELIYGTSYKVQEVLLSIKESLTTKQVGVFVVGLENRKYNKEIVLGEEGLKNSIDGNDHISKNGQMMGKAPKKKVKLN